MNTLYYLSYGSNLHPFRLIQRVPSASLIGTTELTNTKILFHKRGMDGSGKCMILRDDANKPIAYGALFEIDQKEEVLLDRVEGCGKGYNKQLVQCLVDEAEYPAFTYVAASEAIDASLKPYHWYKELVLAGACHHQFPEHYISDFENLESIQDPDDERRLLNEGILERIKTF